MLDPPSYQAGTTWADIDRDLKAGRVEGVPAGTDLEEFLWQTIPESRTEVEARNPGREFTEQPWAKRSKASGAFISLARGIQ
jgi:hypothetical protein